MAQRITPVQYFENGEIPNTEVNYTPLIIFGVCVVAIVAMALAYSKK